MTRTKAMTLIGSHLNHIENESLPEHELQTCAEELSKTLVSHCFHDKWSAVDISTLFGIEAKDESSWPHIQTTLALRILQIQQRRISIRQGGRL